MEDARTEGDLTYYRVDAENLSLPVSTVAEPTDSTLPWQPQPVTITSLADLRETAESYFSPEIVDNLFALSPDHYRDFDGVLYATDGGPREQPVPAGQDRGGGAGGCGPLDGDGHLLRRQLGL